MSLEETQPKKEASAITLSYKQIRFAAFCYMGLPFLIFSVTWLSFVPAIISATITLFILYITCKPEITEALFKKTRASYTGKLLNSDYKESIRIPVWTCAVILIAGGIWVWWSGIGGGFYQSGDFPYRNAVFRDLITYRWPVIYGGEKGMLVYYIGFWLPAALLTKFFGLFISSDQVLWQCGNMFLYLWTLVGIMLVLLTLFFNVKANTVKKVLFATFIFIFFSGMDIVGWFGAGTDGFFSRLVEENIHIEWWAKKISFPSGHLLQYSSFTTELFWVFNQAVITWLATLTLFREQTPANFIFIGMMSLFNGPIPFYGFLVLALVLGILFIIRARRRPRFIIISLFSLSNLLSLIGVFPVCWAYFTGNSAATIKSGSKLIRFVPRLLFNVNGKAGAGLSPKRVGLFIVFLLLEFLLAAILISWHNRKELPFWACVGMLCVFPLFFTGAAADFCMRATIPAMVVFCVYCIRFLFEKYKSPKKSIDRLICIVLALFLVLGSVTPMVEMSRGIYKSVKAGHYITYNDTFKSLNSDKKTAKSIRNFTSQKYEDSTFYRYFARH